MTDSRNGGAVGTGDLGREDWLRPRFNSRLFGWPFFRGLDVCRAGRPDGVELKHDVLLGHGKVRHAGRLGEETPGGKGLQFRLVELVSKGKVQRSLEHGHPSAPRPRASEGPAGIGPVF